MLVEIYSMLHYILILHACRNLQHAPLHLVILHTCRNLQHAELHLAILHACRNLQHAPIHLVILRACRKHYDIYKVFTFLRNCLHTVYVRIVRLQFSIVDRVCEIMYPVNSLPVHKNLLPVRAFSHTNAVLSEDFFIYNQFSGMQAKSSNCGSGGRGDWPWGYI